MTSRHNMFVILIWMFFSDSQRPERLIRRTYSEGTESPGPRYVNVGPPLGRLIISIAFVCLCWQDSHSVVTSQNFGGSPLTLRPWAIQRFLTSDSMDGTVKCDHPFESC